MLLFSGISGGYFEKLFLKSRRGNAERQSWGGGSRIAEWRGMPGGTRKDVKPGF